MRGCLATSLLLNLASVLAPIAGSAKPLVPLLSFVQHWDHHWYAWLPGDPVYLLDLLHGVERGRLVIVRGTVRPAHSTIDAADAAALEATSRKPIAPGWLSRP